MNSFLFSSHFILLFHKIRSMEDLGLPYPMPEHKPVLLVDIGENPDGIGPGWYYDTENGFYIPEYVPPEPTQEEIRALDRDEMLLDQQLLLLDIQAVLTKGGVAHE